jgi:hypothetical protein
MSFGHQIILLWPSCDGAFVVWSVTEKVSSRKVEYRMHRGVMRGMNVVELQRWVWRKLVCLVHYSGWAPDDVPAPEEIPVPLGVKDGRIYFGKTSP